QQVLDLFALVKLRAVDDLVRQAPPPQGVFDRPCQRVHAAENRTVPRLALAIHHRGGDLVGDVVGLARGIGVALQSDRFTFGVLGEQLLVFAPPVVANQLVGDPQDIRR